MAERDSRRRGWLFACVWLAAVWALLAHAGADVGALDSGEIGGAAYMLGVAHPTGFPIDMLLLRCTALLPLGTIAFRQNVGVAVIAASAVTLLSALCHRHSLRAGASALGASVAACVAACALLSSNTFLAAAVSVEVYATALTLGLGMAWLAGSPEPSARRGLWPLAGFALGAHVMAALALLPLCAAALIERARAWRMSVRLALLGAGIVSYLPLASRRDGAFDWGDPESLRGLLRHLSAARIHEAYGAEQWQLGAASSGTLFEQLFEQPWWWVLAAIGCSVSWRKQRGVVLICGVWFSLEVAYASWINPMGVAQRQLGHLSAAVLAFAAGSGAAFVVTRAEAWRAWSGRAVAVLAVLAACLAPARAAWPEARDATLIAERYGATSPLLELAPRALYVCSTDTGCASALFAVYAEGARPDIAVVPAQHLWDPTVTRRLTGLPELGGSGGPSELAALRLAELAGSRQLRPMYAEIWPERGWSGLSLTAAPWLALTADQRPRAAPAAPSVPDLVRLDARSSDADTPAAARAPTDRLPHAGVGDPGDSGGTQARTPDAVQSDGDSRLSMLEHARFGAAGPSSPRARELWANAHAEVGKALLREGESTASARQLARAAALTPESSVALTNLGVAREAAGDLIGALRATERAVELDPQRPTPWVNLARLMLLARGQEAARMVLAEASRHQLQDPRLFALKRALDADHGTTAK